MELGCDAPDEDEEEAYGKNENEFTEWIEDDEDRTNVEPDSDDVVVEMEGGGIDGGGDDDILDSDEEDDNDVEEEDEDEEYWEEKFRKTLSSGDAMEDLVRKSVERNNEFYKKNVKREAPRQSKEKNLDGDETALRGVRAKVSPNEWKIAGIGRWGKRIKKSKTPPELFLRAAVRPFTYRNLVKEIVLTRHAILDGDIRKK